MTAKTSKEASSAATKADIAELRQLMEKMDAKLGEHDKRFDRIDEKLRDHDQRFDVMQKQFQVILAFIEGSVGDVQEQVDDVAKQQSRLGFVLRGEAAARQLDRRLKRVEQHLGLAA